MKTPELRLGAEFRVRVRDRKAAFDLGYNAYEDGKVECVFEEDPESGVRFPGFAAMCRYGWQRAQEDSLLFRQAPSGQTPEPIPNT